MLDAMEPILGSSGRDDSLRVIRDPSKAIGELVLVFQDQVCLLPPFLPIHNEGAHFTLEAEVSLFLGIMEVGEV